MTQQVPAPPRVDRQEPAGHQAWVRSAAKATGGEPGALLPLLHEIQAEFGYVPDGSERIVAEELNLSRADVHGVISFYRDFKRVPQGRVVVRVCRAEACQAVGAEALMRHIGHRTGVKAGQSAPDLSVSVEQVFCFGNCALGPTVEVAGRLYGRMDAQGFDRALEAATGDVARP